MDPSDPSLIPVLGVWYVLTALAVFWPCFGTESLLTAHSQLERVQSKQQQDYSHTARPACP